MLKKVRQLIESLNDTLKDQLNPEQHGGRTFEGVAIRVAQRVLAMARSPGGHTRRPAGMQTGVRRSDYGPIAGSLPEEFMDLLLLPGNS